MDIDGTEICKYIVGIGLGLLTVSGAAVLGYVAGAADL